MIKFEKNKNLDKSMKNLIMSMIEMNNYLATVLDYMDKPITEKKEQELIKILKSYNIPINTLKYDSKILTENPYYKNIKLDNISTQTVRYENDIIKKRKLMNMDFHKPLGKYLFHYEPIGYFDEDVNMPVLKENKNTVWMSPAVSEIQSMNDGIEKGYGNCVTFGLGIGVIPYLWLQKDNVKSVTIVEFNKDVIELFNKYIYPQFNKDKELKIIHGNAFDYFNDDFLKKFDYAYVDFWESSEDGLKSYMKLMEKNITYKNIDYWIEDSILTNIQYVMAPYLYAVYSGQSITDFISSIDFDSKDIVKKVNRYFKSRNNTITFEDELLDIIHNKNILRKIAGQV